MIITYDKGVDKLIKDVITDLSYRGITPLFSTTDYVQGKDVKSNGFFDNECRMFAVAIGKPLDKWLKVFVHESCHFDQWKEQCDTWCAYDKLEKKEEDLLWDWIEKKVEIDVKNGFTKKQLQHVAFLTRELERDCEIRTVQKILDYNLPINVEDYAQGAWAYITFYDYMLETRQWYVIGHEPYNNDSLKDLMPKKLYLNSGISILNDEMRKHYKNCIDPHFVGHQ